MSKIRHEIFSIFFKIKMSLVLILQNYESYHNGDICQRYFTMPFCNKKIKIFVAFCFCHKVRFVYEKLKRCCFYSSRIYHPTCIYKLLWSALYHFSSKKIIITWYILCNCTRHIGPNCCIHCTIFIGIVV